MPSPDKAALRAELTERRHHAFKASPQAGERLVRHFPGDIPIHAGTCVSAYLPIRSEIDPRPLMQALVGRGAVLCLPVTPPRDSGEPLSFRLFEPGTPLRRAGFGLTEPGEAARLVEPQVLLVPLLGFNDQGHRLGYGAGHYDRTLAALRSHATITAIGLAFEEQRVDSMPVEPWDAPLDWILTPDRAYRVPRTS